MASNAENVSIWWRHHGIKMSFSLKSLSYNSISSVIIHDICNYLLMCWRYCDLELNYWNKTLIKHGSSSGLCRRPIVPSPQSLWWTRRASRTQPLVAGLVAPPLRTSVITTHRSDYSCCSTTRSSRHSRISMLRYGGCYLALTSVISMGYYNTAVSQVH